MPAAIIDGKALAARIRDDVARAARELASAGRPAGLAGVLVGDDDGSRMYAEAQAKHAAAVGIEHRVVRLPSTADTRYVVAAIESLNRDASVSGIVVYQPLPTRIDSALVQQAIDPLKDAEGVHPTNLGLLAMGRPARVPCTAAAAFACAKSTEVDLTGKEAVVVGRSVIVGKPVAMLLLGANCTVTQCHTRTRDLIVHCQRADVLIVAAGKARIIGSEHIRPGAVVIDVGTHRMAGPDGTSMTVGDVRFDEAERQAGWITPVPGGVGPVTVAMLLQNVVQGCGNMAVG